MSWFSSLTTKAGTIILKVDDGTGLNVFVSHKPFAEAFVKDRGYSTHYDSDVRAWFIGCLK